MTNLQCYVSPQLTGVVLQNVKQTTNFIIKMEININYWWTERWSLFSWTTQNTFYIYWLLQNSKSQGHILSQKCDLSSVLVFGILQLTKTCLTLLNSHRFCQPYQHYPAQWRIHSASRDKWPDAHGITHTKIITVKMFYPASRTRLHWSAKCKFWEPYKNRNHGLCSIPM